MWRCRGNRRYLQCANNAPIAGVIFALEVILGDFSTTSLSTVVIASVTANQIARIIHGNLPAFAVTPYTLVSAWELPLYAVLGVVAAVVGVVFVRVLYFSEDVFDAWKFPEPLKPMAGDLLIGMIGFAYPQVLGVGHDAIEQALHNTMPLALMATLVVIKMIATSCTHRVGRFRRRVCPLAVSGRHARREFWRRGPHLVAGVHRALRRLCLGRNGGRVCRRSSGTDVGDSHPFRNDR